MNAVTSKIFSTVIGDFDAFKYVEMMWLNNCMKRLTDILKVHVTFQDNTSKNKYIIANRTLSLLSIQTMICCHKAYFKWANVIGRLNQVTPWWIKKLGRYINVDEWMKY